MERQAFAQKYGGYAEMNYLLCNDGISFGDDPTEWSVDLFLYKAEYLLEKKRIEKIK
jgi:hypothetical protein